MLSTWKDIRENNWRTFHLSLIVKDLDKTLAHYQSLDLISSVLQSGDDRHVRYEVHNQAERNKDSERTGPTRVRITRMGPLPLELIQCGAASNDANSEYIDNKGEGISHIAFFVDDIEGETAKMVDKGVRLLLTERVEGKVISHYFDTREYGGIVVEMKQKGAYPDWE